MRAGGRGVGLVVKNNTNKQTTKQTSNEAGRAPGRGRVRSTRCEVEYERSAVVEGGERSVTALILTVILTTTANSAAL